MGKDNILISQKEHGVIGFWTYLFFCEICEYCLWDLLVWDLVKVIVIHIIDNRFWLVLVVNVGMELVELQ